MNMKPTFPLPLVSAAILTFGMIVPALPALASPRDELLRLVPDDMSFCAVMHNLRDRAKKDAAVGAALTEMPFLKSRLDSPEIMKLLTIQQKLFQDLGITPEQLRDDFMGDAVVFAFRHGPADAPEREQGLFLVWARDKTLPVRLLDRVNEMQKKSGELKDLTSLDYKGQAYLERVKANNPGRGREFYFINENLLVFSSEETVLKSVIHRIRTAKPVNETPFWSIMLERLGLDNALLSVLVNPRAFDGDLASSEKTAKGPALAFLKEFRRCWKAFDGIGLYLDPGKNLELGLAVNVRKQALPEAAARWFSELGKPSALWTVIPEDALFALSARTDFFALTEFVSTFCDVDKRKEIRTSVEGSLRAFLPEGAKLEELLKGLGPDWGFWVDAPSTEDKTWAPQIVLAMKRQDSADGKVAEKTVHNAVQFLTMIAQFAAKEPIVHTITEGKLEMKVLSDRSLPEGVRPAFGVKDGYLLFAGSPNSIRRFTAPSAVPDMDETPILRVSAAGWRKYLAEHKNEIAESLAKLTAAPAAEIAGQIDAALPALKTIDRFEIVVRSKQDQATLTFRLKTVAK
jgi:hypothetical protein